MLWREQKTIQHIDVEIMKNDFSRGVFVYFLSPLIFHIKFSLHNGTQLIIFDLYTT